MRQSKRPSLFYLAIFSCLAPMLICFVLDKEFWPFTHFPMYSRLSKPSMWAQVRVFDSEKNKELVLKGEECFKPFGHVRVNYSLLNFYLEKQNEKIHSLLSALAFQIQKNSDSECQFAKGSYLKAYFLTLDTSKVTDPSSPLPVQEASISKEVPLAL